MSNWVLLTPVEQKEYEERGYALLKEDTIKCADCGKSLLEVIKVKEGPQIKEIKALCPCGGSSFIYRIEGESYFQVCEKLSIEDVPTEIHDGIIQMEVQVIDG